jgi:NtrC-family two-component system sensor histidine kinase KinB
MLVNLLSNSLRKKILLGYLVIAGLLVITSGWAIYNFIGLNRAINEIMVSSYRSVGAAQNMIEALEKQDNTEALLLLSDHRDSLDAFLTNQQEFSKWYTVAEGNITFEGEAETLDRIKAGYQEYLKLFSRLNQLHATVEPVQARNFYLNSVLKQFYIVKQMCNHLLRINQNQMFKADQRAKHDAQKAVFSTTVVSLLALFLAIVFGYKISAVIIDPTLKLTESAQKIGEGHLEEAITVNTNDEIGRLAQEFNRMARRLQEYEKSNIEKLIAERRKSDAIVRSIPDPLIVVDAECRIIKINTAAERIFGIQEKRVKGLHVLEVINNNLIFNFIKECSTNRLPIKSTGMEEAIKLKTGDTWSYFLIEAMPAEDREGRLLGIVLFMGDVTHLKEVDQIKSGFVSAASHEFRTPLTSIMMSIGLILDQTVGAINPKQKQLMEVIKEDCNRLTYLVNDLLDLSRMEAGKTEMTKEAVRLINIVQAAANPFTIPIAENGLTLEISPAIAELPPVLVDANKMVRVFNNLIANAIRYTPKGGKLTIDASCETQRILVSVKDTGSGIPLEYQTKIFDKFIQVKNNEANQSGGAGLGLAMVKEIIQAHGSDIWVESEVHQGSNFLFYLPLAPTKPEEDDTDEQFN